MRWLRHFLGLYTEAEKFDRGAEWAKSELDRGITPGDLYTYCDDPVGGRSAFDYGAIKAIDDACSTGRVIDDRPIYH